MDWQDSLDTWKSRLTILHEKKYMADCAFILNDGRERFEIKAHKMILASCSSKFQNLYFLCGATDDEIIVRDVTQEALISFVEYVYKETTDLTMVTIWDILKLAKLYAVKSLERFCATYLEKNLNKDNVLTIFDRSSVYDLDLVKTKCMDIISELTVEVYQNPSFYSISAETLKALLKFDKIPGKEIEIYRAVNKWSEIKCEEANIEKSSTNKKLILENCLDEIRFCLMTNEEFNSCVDDSFLSKEEIYDIFRKIASNGAHKCKFSSIKRLNKTGSVQARTNNVKELKLAAKETKRSIDSSIKNNTFAAKDTGTIKLSSNNIRAQGLVTRTNNVKEFAVTPNCTRSIVRPASYLESPIQMYPQYYYPNQYKSPNNYTINNFYYVYSSNLCDPHFT